MWKDLHPYQPNISGDPATVRCLGDFVLVRPFPPADLIINPGVKMTQDKRWRQDRDKGNRTGEVIAVGPGDKMVELMCNDCCKFWWRAVHADSTKIRLACDVCGGDKITMLAYGDMSFAQVYRADMDVQVGDIVVFPQVPANEIEINGEKLVFLHQECHVLAVIEDVAA